MLDVGHDVYILIRMYGVHKAEKFIIQLYEKGSISEKLMYAYIDELENYY